MKKQALILSTLIFSFFIACNTGENTNTDEPATEKEATAETPEKTEKSAKDIGMDYAMSTKAELAKNLFGAIQDQGAADALSFCNVHANPITDSLETAYDVSIRRVTDKPRNQENAATEMELAHIETYKKALAEGKELEAIVNETESMINFYYPIVTNAMCLQCHGAANTDIDKATLTQLEKNYPKDKAQGYKINEIRGIWSIAWSKEG